MTKFKTQKAAPCKVFDHKGKLVGVAKNREEMLSLVSTATKNLPARKAAAPKTFFQDGNEFYLSDGTVWSASEYAGKKIVQHDYDMEGASTARRLFTALHPGHTAEDPQRVVTFDNAVVA